MIKQFYKVIELKNKMKIYHLVRNHFSLTKDSLKLFKYRLLQEPHIAKEYANILKNSKDLRVKIPIKEREFEIVDDGWKEFNKCFSSFVESINISYMDFRNNKVFYKAQFFKLKKAIIDFYINNLSSFIYDFTNTNYNEECISVIKETLTTFNLKNIEIQNMTFNPISKEIIRIFINDEIFADINLNFVKKTKEIPKYIEKAVMGILENIGIKKMPVNKKLYIVLSLNFADWFLSASGQKWGTCISLDSEHYEATWAGLPGLIGDKNRAMVYVTDGKKKKYFNIEVDNILSRAFILTVRNKENNETGFSFVKEYPNEFGIKALAQKYFGMNFISSLESVISRYYLEFLFHNVYGFDGFVSFIFQDTTKLKIAYKNKVKYFPTSYGYFYIGEKGGLQSILKQNNRLFEDEGKNYGWNYRDGLSCLVKNNLSIKDFWSDDRHERDKE
jgi:hypothetical protein